MRSHHEAFHAVCTFVCALPLATRTRWQPSNQLTSRSASSSQVIEEIYGVPPDELRVFVHYQPQFYHFHGGATAQCLVSPLHARSSTGLTSIHAAIHAAQCISLGCTTTLAAKSSAPTCCRRVAISSPPTIIAPPPSSPPAAGESWRAASRVAPPAHSQPSALARRTSSPPSRRTATPTAPRRSITSSRQTTRS